MKFLLTHCYLERRRIAFASLMAFVASFVFSAHIKGTVFGLPIPVFIGFFYMFAVGLAATLTTFFFPKLRRLVDGIAFSRVSIAFSAAATQSYEIVKAPFASAVILVSSAIVLLAIGRHIERLAKKENASQALVTFVAIAGAMLHWLDNSEGYAKARGPEAASVGAARAKTRSY